VSRPGRSLLRPYLVVAGVVLFGQGAASLLVRAAGRDPHGSTRLLSDPAHATIHLVWGALVLGVLAGRLGAAIEARLAVGFGVFYVGLLALGVAVHHPFGLMIDAKENAFHAVVGPLALILGLHAMLTGRRPRTGHPTEAR
jgi:hypothetical protein